MRGSSRNSSIAQGSGLVGASVVRWAIRQILIGCNTTIAAAQDATNYGRSFFERTLAR
jgi:hypothetical protein